jgi:hypothetical protein
MPTNLAEEIYRGRRAIVAARERGLETIGWEQVLADLERQALLAWASELAEQNLVLSYQVRYVEASRSAITTGRVSWYAAHYLKTIVSARDYQQHPRLCWGQWTPKWWQELEMEAIQSLEALQRAICDRQT